MELMSLDRMICLNEGFEEVRILQGGSRRHVRLQTSGVHFRGSFSLGFYILEL